MTSDIDKLLTIHVVVQGIKALTSPWGIRFRPVPVGVEKHHVSSSAAGGNRSADGVGSRARKGGREQGMDAVKTHKRERVRAREA